ncbi:MAG: T9SS type A sorting domain-containing protein [Chlorobi bacterium]|nr:T9SS type A sorting domain-containing protein [Chlorobiota bacterium]
MKNLSVRKIIYVILIKFTVFAQVLFSHNAEIFIGNLAGPGNDIWVKFYPVRSLLKGPIDVYSPVYYSMSTILWPSGWDRRNPPIQNDLKYIMGLDGVALLHSETYGFWRLPYTPTYGEYLFIGSDAVPNNYADGIFGLGHYVLELYNNPLNEPFAVIPIDWLDEHYIRAHLYIRNADLNIKVYSWDPVNITFQWLAGEGGQGDEISLWHPLLDPNDMGKIKVYRQYHRYNVALENWEGNFFTPIIPVALSDNDPLYRKYPLDATDPYFVPSPYTVPKHVNPELLNVNLDIQAGHWSYVRCSKSFTVTDGITLKLKSNPNTKFIVGDVPNYPACGAVFNTSAGSTLHLEANTELIVEQGCTWNDLCGEIILEPGSCILIRGTYNPCNTIDRVISNSSFLVMESGGVLNIPSNRKLIFDGAGSFLKVLPGNCQIKLGQGASIEFKNGAYIDTNGCTFTSLNSGDKWNGILLENAGTQSIIQNCTFNDFTNGVTISNSQGYESWLKVLNYNTFNMQNGPPMGCTGVSALNVFNFTVSGNTFNLGTNEYNLGLYIQNNTGQSGGGAGPGSSYSLNILSNTFNGSANPLMINCLASSLTPFLIKRNIFNTTYGYPSYGIFANKITGNIKNNFFNDLNSNQALTLQQSSVNLFDNVFKSTYKTIILQSSSYGLMVPIQNPQGQWVWYGGYNKLTTDVSNNIDFTNGVAVISPKGYNCFNVIAQPNYHLVGQSCQPFAYNAVENYWSPNPPSFDIECSGFPWPVVYEPYLSNCPYFVNPAEDGIIEDLGNGIYDTIFVTSGGEGGSHPNTMQKTTSTDRILYYEAITKRKQGDFAGAILKCKELINSHDTSKYFMSAVDEIYLNYLESDTTSNQNITNVLFNALKTYLGQKVQQYSGNNRFIEKAYKYILMCLVKTETYSEAIAGYENIMNNHTDPVVRLNANWDRGAVVFLMGQGGGISVLSEKNYAKKMKRLLDKNPVHKKAEETFKESRNNYESDRSKYTKEEKAELNRRIERFNPVSNVELQSKIISDIKLLNFLNNKQLENDASAFVPKRFKLHQNYPNPFNPVTTIKYDIPKDNFVLIKIYDLLGREIFTESEFKKAGRYEVKFDGSNFASGLYFYKFEAGNFVETKKMVLIK